ncbi:adenylosuccinate synthase [Sporosarcina luteola]|nr:adenylosuccinate synthase [Sporosarcina luteola]
MSEIHSQKCKLNIWYYLPDEVWNKVAVIYERMPGWMGHTNGIPYWFGQEEDDVFIMASVDQVDCPFMRG